MHIINSAGFIGANPTRIFIRPLSISFCDMVDRSHFKKKASCCLTPIKMPFFHDCVKKFFTCNLTFVHVISVFGSKATQTVPFLMEVSRKINNRTTLMYLNSGSVDSVLAPQISNYLYNQIYGYN